MGMRACIIVCSLCFHHGRQLFRDRYPASLVVRGIRVCEVRQEGLDRPWFAKEKALSFVAAERDQPISLRLGLDPLGNSLETEGLAHHDHGAYDAVIALVMLQILNEGLVDLDLCEP